MSQLILPGDAGPGDVRNTRKFSAGMYYNAQGALVDRTGAAVVLTPGATDIVIPAGAYGGLAADGKVAAVVFNAATLLNDTTIAGTAGTMPNNASPTATITTQGGTKVVPAGYSPGGTVTASLPDNGSQSASLTSQGASKTIPAGYTSSGGTVSVALPDNGSQSITLTTQGATKTVPAGYTSSGGVVTASMTGLVASVITAPNVAGGITGTATIESLGGKKVAYGNGAFVAGQLTVTGLAFQPSTINVSWYDGKQWSVTYRSASVLAAEGNSNGEPFPLWKVSTYAGQIPVALTTALATTSNGFTLKDGSTQTYTFYYVAME